MCSFRAKFATVAFVGLLVTVARNSHGIEKIIKHITSRIFELYNNRKRTSWINLLEIAPPDGGLFSTSQKQLPLEKAQLEHECAKNTGMYCSGNKQSN
jgi:hypothetical protein